MTLIEKYVLILCPKFEKMADNYLEKQYEEYLKTKVAKEEARKAQWRKQIKAYQARMKAEAEAQKQKDRMAE